ncbi:MAG: transposase [Solirubrobacterales bacterium]
MTHSDVTGVVPRDRPGAHRLATARKKAARRIKTEHLDWALKDFSGYIAADELYDGPFCILSIVDNRTFKRITYQVLSRDPKRDDIMAFSRRFQAVLEQRGLVLRGITTDGLSLYPAPIAEVFGDVPHQLCTFHVIKEITKLILDAVRRLRHAIKRWGQGGRKKKRGRKSQKAKATAARRGPTVKEKASFVFRHRHLIVKHRENLTPAEREDLVRMLAYLPELATLRRFADRIYWLFDTPKDYHQASCRRTALLRDPEFRAVPELVQALEQLAAEKFPKLMAYLNGPAHRRVRTNNHVERTNRLIRFLEKVRYKWRRRRTLVRFVMLTLDRIGSAWTITHSQATDRPKPTGPGRTESEKGKRRRAA